MREPYPSSSFIIHLPGTHLAQFDHGQFPSMTSIPTGKGVRLPPQTRALRQGPQGDHASYLQGKWGKQEQRNQGAALAASTSQGWWPFSRQAYVDLTTGIGTIIQLVCWYGLQRRPSIGGRYS